MAKSIIKYSNKVKSIYRMEITDKNGTRVYRYIQYSDGIIKEVDANTYFQNEKIFTQKENDQLYERL